MGELTAAQEAMKEQFLRGSANPSRSWGGLWDGLLQFDPGLFQASADLVDHHWRRRFLDPKSKEFVALALAAQASTLFVPGVETHLRRALSHGATPAEIVEVLGLVSLQGLSCCSVGFPILLEELRAAGQAIDESPLTSDQEGLRCAFEAAGSRIGRFGPLVDGLLRLDPEFLEIVARLVDVPWKTGNLSAKLKELILVAMDAACTNLHREGLRRHIRDALAAGATKDELTEVLEMATTVGLLACATGVPALLETLGDSDA